MLNKFFDRICCINLDKRSDRWSKCEEEFKGIGVDVERLSACFGENNHLAFNQSQYKALGTAGYRTLILEDDVVFRGYNHLPNALGELPEDWDIIFLGANLLGIEGLTFKPPTRYSEHLFTVNDAWQTHAVGYSKKMVEWILANFNPNEFPIYDEWLRVNVLPKFKCFIVAPQVALQRADYSDIWSTHADYTSCFSRGNELLK